MTKIVKTKWLALGVVATVTVLVAGCDTFMGTRDHHRATSLYSYLYSGQKEHVDTPTIPTLSLPLRVGIAFVPSGGNERTSYAYAEDLNFPESQKMELMKQISAQFKQYPFVKSIELIPTAYLTPKGGFANLDQIRSMYDVDVMTLLSYDQVQFTDEGVLSLTYLTVVGAYIIPGEKNDTRTMMDAAVYDIASRKLLFRAPGVGDIKGLATPINLNEELRDNSKAGFQKASTNMVANLKVELADFKERVTNAPTEYKIQFKPGYTGGAFGGMDTVAVAGLGACFLWLHRNRKTRKA